MKREHFSELGYHIKRRREQHLLRRRKLARLIGFEDSKEGAAAIRALEERGIIEPPDLLDRVAVVLHLDAKQIQELQHQDRQAAAEWLKNISQPARPYLGIRSVPWPSMAEIPEHVRSSGETAIENYARGFAAYHKLRVHAVLSNRIQIVIDDAGDFVSIRELGRDGWLDPELTN